MSFFAALINFNSTSFEGWGGWMKSCLFGFIIKIICNFFVLWENVLEILWNPSWFVARVKMKTL